MKSALQPAVSHSDDKGGMAGVSVGIWSAELVEPGSGHIQTPTCHREMQLANEARRVNSTNESRTIFEIEGTGQLLVLRNWAHILKKQDVDPLYI